MKPINLQKITRLAGVLALLLLVAPVSHADKEEPPLQSCGWSENYLEAHGWVTLALDEHAQNLDVKLLQAGSVIVQWDESEKCVALAKQDETGFSAKDEYVESGCFVLATLNQTGQQALRYTALFALEKPHAVTALAWAVSNEPQKESRYPRVHSRVMRPGQETWIIDHSQDEPRISCGSDDDAEQE